ARVLRPVHAGPALRAGALRGRTRLRHSVAPTEPGVSGWRTAGRKGDPQHPRTRGRHGAAPLACRLFPRRSIRGCRYLAGSRLLVTGTAGRFQSVSRLAVMTRAAVQGSITQLVGNTPLLRIRLFEERYPDLEIYAKAEWFNPGGSVKDRAALSMIEDGERRGRLTPDKVIIDSTSGNTGVAYALVGAAKGYRVLLVMPANGSAERSQLVSAYGAEVIFSDGMEGSDGAIRMVREMVSDNPDAYFYPDQYNNAANPLAHYHGTGREILQQIGGRLTHFV